MGKRKISILEPAATAIAEIAWFIEHKGLPDTAKKFVNDAFNFFEKLSDERVLHINPVVTPNGKLSNIDVCLIKINT